MKETVSSVSRVDRKGHFGPYGGQFAPETLMPALAELERAYEEARRDPAFQVELDGYLKDYVGRATPLTRADRLTRVLVRRSARVRGVALPT